MKLSLKRNATVCTFVFAALLVTSGVANAETNIVSGGTWDDHSVFIDGLVAPFIPQADETIRINYIAGGFDQGGVSYDFSRGTGEAATAAEILDASGPVNVVGFSQGADAAGGGIRSAVNAGADSSQLSFTAVASPDQPVTGLRNRLPIDLPGISRGTNGNVSGVQTNWVCLGHELVCNAPSDADPLKWLNGVAEYQLQHGAAGACNYANPQACGGETFVRVEGNQTFTNITTEAGLVQMANNANVALPEPVKEGIRVAVADGGPVYKPTPSATPAPAPQPSPVAAAHDFVGNLGADTATTAALHNGVTAIAGVFGLPAA